MEETGWTYWDVIMQGGPLGWLAAMACVVGLGVGVVAPFVRMSSGAATVLGFLSIIPLLAAGAVSYHFRVLQSDPDLVMGAALSGLTDNVTRIGAVCSLAWLVGVVASQWLRRGPLGTPPRQGARAET